jgi:Flavin containing amine oxidoreductase
MYSDHCYALMQTLTTTDYQVLSEPLLDAYSSPRICFAGEATSRYHPSTTTGMFLQYYIILNTKCVNLCNCCITDV